jgi:hypothetical protein
MLPKSGVFTGEPAKPKPSPVKRALHHRDFYFFTGEVARVGPLLHR